MRVKFDSNQSLRAHSFLTVLQLIQAALKMKGDGFKGNAKEDAPQPLDPELVEKTLK